MDSLIGVSDATKRYASGGQPAVDRVRLEVAQLVDGRVASDALTGAQR
jgi:hypothetical protein